MKKTEPQTHAFYTPKRRRVVHKEPKDLTPNLATQQQFRDECDVNRIVKNAQRGIPPRWLAQGAPQYGDFSNIPDLTEAYNRVQNAEAAFMDLPSGLREELRNDPRNITQLTQEQVVKYRLGKPTPPADPASPEAGQAAPTGTEPVAKKPQKETQ